MVRAWRLWGAYRLTLMYYAGDWAHVGRDLGYQRTAGWWLTVRALGAMVVVDQDIQF